MLSNKWTYSDTAYSQPANNGLPLCYEFVSKYRRVIVVGEGSGFELRVSYKGLPVKSWAKRFGAKEDAVAWAIVQSDNNQIISGSVTVKDFLGKRKI